MTKRAVFVGRWSPFHNGHLAMMQKKIDEGKPLLILVRNTSYDIDPPEMRKEMIVATMARMNVDARVEIIDNIESINYGLGAGYEVNEIEVSLHVKEISATKIRELIEQEKAYWKRHMPEGAVTVLEKHLNKQKAEKKDV